MACDKNIIRMVALRGQGMSQCWYCHNTAVEVWHCERNEHNWPMCRLCAAIVWAALALRRHGEVGIADRLDTAYGIDTRSGPGFERWIEPAAEREIMACDKHGTHEGRPAFIGSYHGGAGLYVFADGEWICERRGESIWSLTPGPQDIEEVRRLLRGIRTFMPNPRSGEMEETAGQGWVTVTDLNRMRKAYEEILAKREAADVKGLAL